MTILVTPDGSLAQIDEHIDILRRLLCDLEKLRRSGVPTSSSLSEAPFLDEWSFAHRLVPCLSGYPEGHPTCRSGRMARTSDLWVIAPEQRYARTLTRFYRLGARAEASTS
jgi:hypothetical protein